LNKIKTYILIIFLLISSISVAQNFKTSVFLSPGISVYKFNNKFIDSLNNVNISKNHFSYSISLREEYFFPKIISIGLELGYLYTQGTFKSYYHKPPLVYIPIFPVVDTTHGNTLSIHAIDVPLFIRFRTKDDINKGMYFYVGSGLSYILYSERSVELVRNVNRSSYDIMPLTNGKVKLKTGKGNRIGTIGIMGIGKNFRIEKFNFFSEIRYGFDINNWLYPTYEDPVFNYIDIKRHNFMLNLGMTF
jgi:hypothetical protein